MPVTLQVTLADGTVRVSCNDPDRTRQIGYLTLAARVVMDAMQRPPEAKGGPAGGSSVGRGPALAVRKLP